MSRSIRALLPLLVGVLAGCASAAPDPVPKAAPTAVDAAGLRAQELRRSCRGRSTCYNDALLAVLREQGVEPALRTLERLADADPEVKRDGHMYVHSVGLAAYTSPQTVGQTFRACTAAFQSGCYHGVIQAYFVDLTRSGQAVDQRTVNALCADYRGSEADRWLLFQCVHGAGHGLTMLYGHDLPRALAGCDLLTDPWEREGCYGGAFMENVVQATTPHHAVGRPDAEGAAAADEHAGHDMPADAHAGHDTAAAQPEFRALDPGDPLHPCSALEERYLSACYQMQTSAILHFNGYDVAAAARVCDRAPGPYRASCYLSLGRDISSITLQDHAAARRLCGHSAVEFATWCHVGYTKNLIDLTASTDSALEYCRALPVGEAKGGCYHAVGEQVWVLSPDWEGRARQCEAAEPEFREMCRAGAGLAARTGGAAPATPER